MLENMICKRIWRILCLRFELRRAEGSLPEVSFIDKKIIMQSNQGESISLLPEDNIFLKSIKPSLQVRRSQAQESIKQ